MKRLSDFIWPVLGLLAFIYSFHLLYGELSGTSWHDIVGSWSNISVANWALALLSSIVAYAALAWYDRIALLHLGHKLGWFFISLVSFTTYALSHNIGASVFSGALVRYRAYSTKGLSAPEIGVLVAFTAFTFFLGTITLGGLVFVLEPHVVSRAVNLPPFALRSIGLGMLTLVSAYVVGSALNLKPLVIMRRVIPAVKLGSFTMGPLSTPEVKLEYPHLNIALRQLAAGPLELLGAAAIIYFALPEIGNPGYFVVLGVFLMSFSLGLVSNVPGGVGVMDAAFLALMHGGHKSDVFAAVLVWRLLYLLIPLALSGVTVLLFERARLAEALHKKRELAHQETAILDTQDKNTHDKNMPEKQP